MLLHPFITADEVNWGHWGGLFGHIERADNLVSPFSRKTQKKPETTLDWWRQKLDLTKHSQIYLQTTSSDILA